jgi:hypothetical protein
MDGRIDTSPLVTPPPAAPQVKAQHYDTAMRKVRLSMQGLAWTKLLTTYTRHYKTGKGLRTGNGIYGGAELVAWLHALDASPWVLPQPDAEAAVAAAHVDGHDGLATGAAALSDLPSLRIVRIETVGLLEAWVQRVGPCVMRGPWTANLNTVIRETESIGLPDYEAAAGMDPIDLHAVAIVGIKPDHFRIVNDRGVGWGALGRAWMPRETAHWMLRHAGECWGVVPVDLTPKRGAK